MIRSTSGFVHNHLNGCHRYMLACLSNWVIHKDIRPQTMVVINNVSKNFSKIVGLNENTLRRECQCHHMIARANVRKWNCFINCFGQNGLCFSRDPWHGSIRDPPLRGPTGTPLDGSNRNTFVIVCPDVIDFGQNHSFDKIRLSSLHCTGIDTSHKRGAWSWKLYIYPQRRYTPTCLIASSLSSQYSLQLKCNSNNNLAQWECCASHNPRPKPSSAVYRIKTRASADVSSSDSSHSMVKAHQVLVHEDEGNLCEKKPVLGQQKFNGQVESVADSLLKLEIISRISRVVG